VTDENVAQQDSNQNGQQQNPEGMVEDVKEPQGAGVAAAPGDSHQQGNMLTISLILARNSEIASSFSNQAFITVFLSFLCSTVFDCLI